MLRRFFILQNPILRTKSCATCFITQSGWVFHFHLTEICQLKHFVPHQYQFQRGISGEGTWTRPDYLVNRDDKKIEGPFGGKNCTESRNSWCVNGWGCGYIGAVHSGPKCAQSWNQIQTLKIISLVTSIALTCAPHYTKLLDIYADFFSLPPTPRSATPC